MILKTLKTMGPRRGYGIARPAPVRLEQKGSIAPEWGFFENNRKTRLYKVKPAGRKEPA